MNIFALKYSMGHRLCHFYIRKYHYYRQTIRWSTKNSALSIDNFLRPLWIMHSNIVETSFQCQKVFYFANIMRTKHKYTLKIVLNRVKTGRSVLIRAPRPSRTTKLNISIIQKSTRIEIGFRTWKNGCCQKPVARVLWILKGRW